MSRKIWILGSSNTDYTYVVETLPHKGETVSTKNYSIATGGKGANQAIAAAYWGAEVQFIGAVGQDADGDQLLATLHSHGIDTRQVSVIADVASGHAIIFVDTKGDNVIVIHGGANHKVPNCNPDEIDIEKDDLLVFQLEINEEAIHSYVGLAKQRGALIVLNPSPYKALPAEILQRVDLLVVNETEACQMGESPIDDIDTAQVCGSKIIEKYGIGTVVVTLGSLGAVVVFDKRPAVHLPGYSVDVLDTQGAGDAFLGSLVAKIAARETIETATAFANWVAAQSVTKHGSTQVSLPDREKSRSVDYNRFSVIQ